MSAAADSNRPLHASEADEERKKVTMMIMKLFQRWDIDTEAQLTLLGMKPSSRAILSKYRTGERSIPDDVDKLNRAGFLLLIHKCLRLLFPENPNIVYTWIKRGNKNFNGDKPLNFIKKHGLLGLVKVARYLEFEMVR